MTVASQLKQTIASLKGSEATLRIYEAQTNDEETKTVFNETLKEAEDITRDLELRLQVIENQEPQYKGN